MFVNYCVIARLLAILLMLSIMLFSINGYANTPLENYQTLTNLKHLNTEKNRSFVNQIATKVVSDEYRFVQAPTYAYIAKLKANDGNWLEGKHYLGQAISTLSAVKNDDLLIDTLENISWIFFIRGDYTEAIFYVQKMADHAYVTGNQRGQISALNRLALSYIELELYELAIEPLELALGLARETKNYDSEFLALLYLINTRIALPNANPQDTLALTLVADLVPSKLNIDDGYLPRLKGVIHQQLGHWADAEKWLKLAEKKAKDNHDVRLLQMVTKSLSEFYLATNKPRIALNLAISSSQFNNQLQHSNSQAALDYLLSNIYQRLGDDENSLKHLRAYAEFQTTASDKNTVNLITTMDKRIDSIKQQQQLIELENSTLTNQVIAQESMNKQQLYIFIILALILVFCFFIIVFIVRHQMLKAQILLSMKDELTGAYSRSYLANYLPALQSRFEREPATELSLGALIIDCDDFKFINDTFGHAGGDKALKSIVACITTQIREHDLLLRWGGDEFVVVCESISQKQIRELAHRITRSISDLLIEYDEVTLTVTVSTGYAWHNKAKSFNFDGLVNTADEFLLATKRTGKNNSLGDGVNVNTVNKFTHGLTEENI